MQDALSLLGELTSLVNREGKPIVIEVGTATVTIKMDDRPGWLVMTHRELREDRWTAKALLQHLKAHHRYRQAEADAARRLGAS